MGAKTYRLQMPEFVWEGGSEIAMAFLAGLIDSDGTVGNGKAVYSSASVEFAKDVAVLASLYGMGGGVTMSQNVAATTRLRKSALPELRMILAAHMAHPERKRKLIDYAPSAHERKFCMPLHDDLKHDLFGRDHAPATWLRMPVGDTTVHLGRLQYEGIVNPIKLVQAVSAMARTDEIATNVTDCQLDGVCN